MLSILVTLISLSTIATTKVFAATDVDFRDRLGPVRDQGETGLCFAHAAADALSLEAEKRISSLSVAFRYFGQRQGTDYIVMNPTFGEYRGGWGSKALALSANSKLCLADQTAPDNSFNENDLIRLIDIHRQYRATMSPTKPVEIFDALRGMISKLFPGIDPAKFEEKLRPFRPLSQTLGLMMDEACTAEIPGANERKVIGSEISLPSAKQNLEIINAALDKKHAAIVHYNPDLLFEKSAPWYAKVIGFHVSTIIGRQTRADGNWYLLRNTWGPDCRYYAPGVRSQCKDGHVWISEAVVAKEMTSAAYLDDAPATR